MLHGYVFVMGWKQTSFKHFDNTTMHHTPIFYGFKNETLQTKNCDIFLIFAEDIDFEYI